MRIELGVLLMTVALAGCRPRPTAEIEDPSAPPPAQLSGGTNIVWPPEQQTSRISPERVCDHVIEMMLIELGPEAGALGERELAEIRTTCVREGEAERLSVGEEEFTRQAECVLAASRIDELTRCEHGADTSGSVAANREVCEHVVDIMKREFGGVDATNQPSPEELQQFIEQCVVDLDAERAKLGDAEYGTMVGCVMAATRMDELMGCDQDNQ